MKKREERYYGKAKLSIEIPNLIEIQKKSYENFLQKDIPPAERKNQGLQAVFNEVFPITSTNENITLEFVSYSLGEPKYSVIECKERNITYAAPLKVTIRMIIKEGEEEKKVKEIKEQEVFFCELPLMTENGTFIINGAERVIVNQLHRSPGLIFENDKEKTKLTGKNFLIARLIPYRGSWLEFEFDTNYILYARIDRKKKILATVIIRALGYETDEEIISLFYKLKEVDINEKSKKEIIGKVIAENIDGVAKIGDKIDESIYESLKEKRSKIKIIEHHESDVYYSICNTLLKTNIKTTDEALLDIFKKLRGQPLKIENARIFFHNLFFNSKRYSLGNVGRVKINQRLGFDTTKTVLTKEDIIGAIKLLIKKMENNEDEDDIDHLGNRRVRSAGELVENQFRIGLVRMERVIRERLNYIDVQDVMPNLIMNTRIIAAAIKEFFGTSQLSQFMDQTNPLSELTHKRRISALGPGGLTKERAGFEVRDVHYSHYGKICPIETPEGPNIGLITSLTIYARLNKLGFIETPYRVVKNGVVLDQIEYLSADEEENYIIGEANVELDKNNRIINPEVSARYKGEFVKVPPSKINFLDISPSQIVSVTTGLIPFLEHNDANRALMGSNMQRQAVPLIQPEAPLVRVGIEEKVARDSGIIVVAKRAGTVDYVDGEKIVVVTDNGEIDTYHLLNFMRTNQDTCYDQRPIVKKGDKVKKGDVLADGPCTENGKIALGRNLLVAFMPWEGYNFEDAIVISERVVRDDIFTSIHIKEFEIEARDTKLGKEEITKDIPNISEEGLKNLDDNGIIKVGSYVKPGDILVGKVAPKGETELTPEEKFLRAIFGEKAKDVIDVSLRVPPGVEGQVIGVKVFSRKERENKKEEAERKKELSKIIKREIEQIEEETKEEIKSLSKELRMKLKEAKSEKEKKEIKESFMNRIAFIKEKAKNKKNEIEMKKKKELERITKGDELPIGVNKLVKVYIARKRKIEVGDKMAGRHGNKGVIAKILPIEDMPYLPDGTPVDIVLNPLGVPSRMNVGQLFETLLGWAAHTLNFEAITPVFEGAKESEIKEALKEANLPISGKITLYDGRTGEKFDNEVTVGYIYMMKLHHLVDDKIHARSIGSYSLITQQPLGGKAQFGGQRFGEMEVWALEGYGAAHTLQEMLTIKSDDVEGRIKTYEAIVRGENTPEPSMPESFNVLIKELESLCIKVDLLSQQEVDKIIKRKGE